MRTMDFDAIAASAPLDRSASVIRDGSGDLWEATIPATVNRWMAPPELAVLAGVGGDLVKQFAGKRAGRLTILGVWKGGNPKKNATWVCRCDCSYYEGFKLKALNRAMNGEHEEVLCCTACQRLDLLRKRGGQTSTKAARRAEQARLDLIAAQAKRSAA